MKTVLFLCTGNYYRSRFAEIYFNFLTAQTKLGWQADSRGLMVGSAKNVGEISVYTREYLREIKIDFPEIIRFPAQLTSEDLEKSDLIIALDEEEHRPMILKLFPDWEDKTEFWLVHDTHLTLPEIALPKIKADVENLITRLSSKGLIVS